MAKQGDCFVPRNDVGKAASVRHCEKTPQKTLNWIKNIKVFVAIF